MPDTYYSAKEARERLGVPEATFHAMVKAGRIKKVIRQGYKQGQYRVRDIEAMVVANEMMELSDQSLQLDFKEATLETQPDELALARMIYGEGTSRFDEARKAFLGMVPGMTHYLYDGNFLVASLNLLPMEQAGIEKFREGERGWLLGGYTKPFAPGPQEAIIIDFMTTPRAPRPHRTLYARHLLARMAGVFVEWGKQGIEITTLYACGSTPDGMKNLTNDYFQYLGEPRPGRKMYMMDVEHTEMNLLQGYKKTLARYKKKYK